MSVLSRYFGGKAKKPNQTKTTFPTVMLGDMEGAVGTAGTSRMSDFEDYLGAVTIPNVYMAVSVIAYAAANLPMDVLDENDVVIEDLPTRQPDLAALLAHPNTVSDAFHFRELQILDLLLTGNNIVAKDEYFGDKPTALYRLRPDRVRVVFDGFGTERTLTYTLLNTAQGGSTVAAAYALDEIIHWRTANPRDPIWGLGYIEAGEVAFSTNRALNETLRAYFERGAILDGVIELPQEDLSDVEYNRLISRWRSMRQKGRAQIKTGVLTGGAKYKSVQEPLGSLPVVQLKQMARNEVLELFGVPPPKLGDFQGANWRNAQEADAFFYAETITPLLRRIEYGWSSIVQLWNPDWKVKFRIPDLASDFSARADAASKLAMADSITRNEIREKAGFPPLAKGDFRGDEIVNTSTAARGALPVTGGQNDPTATAPQSRQEVQASTSASTVEQNSDSS